MSEFNLQDYKPKSFWQRPEGVTGAIFGGALLLGGGYLLYTMLPILIGLAANTIYLLLMVLAIAALLYMVFDPRMRNLVWYGYKSVMRWVTGLFVQIDPIGILKSYVEDMQDNLRKMSKQIGNLKGQMRRLEGLITQNNKEIDQSMLIANKAKERNNKKQMVLKVRKAGRLKESNVKLSDLHKKMGVLYKVLKKMYENSEILLEDTKDQVRVKEIERKAIRTSHSAMNSAMNIMRGNEDKRVMFDRAMEAIAEDVSNKVGEMERFMDISANFMDSVDLQNGVFEEEGLKMLEKWEKESESLLLGEDKATLLLDDGNETSSFDLDQPIAKPEKRQNSGDSDYSNLFD